MYLETQYTMNNNVVKFKIIESINYTPVFNRTVIKGSAGSIITDHIDDLRHITEARTECVWFWQQDSWMAGNLCTDDVFNYGMVIDNNDPHYHSPIFRCNIGDKYDIYWLTGKMITIEIKETCAGLNYMEFSTRVIIPAMYKLLPRD